MENKFDLMEIAEACVSKVQYRCENTKGMSDYDVFYASIMEDGELVTSSMPHVLKGSDVGIVIHRWYQLAVTLSYDNYLIQIIKSNGEVLDGKIDDDYTIRIAASTYDHPAKLWLIYKDKYVYKIGREYISGNYAQAWENSLKFVWALYQKCRKHCNTAYECELMGKLADTEKSMQALEDKLTEAKMKDLYLQEELKQYRDMMDQLAEIIPN